MYHCNKCDKNFENRYSYIAHCRIHSNYVRPKNPNSRRNKPPKTICIYCGKTFQNGRSLGGHMTHCEFNPNHNLILQNMSKASPKRKWSEEDKKKISRRMIEFLMKNPDKVPYKLNHSSKMSYPERVFENALKSANISGWTYNYQNGIYSYDFAFPVLKIDVEIDGNTHIQEKVRNIDKRRDKFSTNNGWIVIRFTANEIKEDVLKCINTLKTFL